MSALYIKYSLWLGGSLADDNLNLFWQTLSPPQQGGWHPAASWSLWILLCTSLACQNDNDLTHPSNGDCSLSCAHPRLCWGAAWEDSGWPAPLKCAEEHIDICTPVVVVDVIAWMSLCGFEKPDSNSAITVPSLKHAEGKFPGSKLWHLSRASEKTTPLLISLGERGGEGGATFGRRDEPLGHTHEKRETWIPVSAQLEEVQPLKTSLSGR